MRILVIDDDRDMCQAICEGLKSESFAADAAYGGAEGSYAARVNDYDLIVLDNRMPDKDGRTVCAEIRAAEKRVPIIILSAVTHASEKVALLDAGADDYLAKPFSFGELMARIRALLRRPREMNSVVLTVDTLSLDTRAQRVRRSGADIYLTRKEYMLLEYLMRHEEAVLSRGMLMEHVWDMNADPFSNTIEAHIRSLRRKIERDGERKLIYTVPGRGYKIEGDLRKEEFRSAR